MVKKVIVPPSLPPPKGFNHGILCSGGQLLFLAGQDASDAQGKIVALGDMVGQYEQVLKNLQAVVVEAGGAMQDIVKMNIFVSNRDLYIENLKALGQVHQAYFGRYYPTTALFEIVSFYKKGNLIEVEGIAYLDA